MTARTKAQEKQQEPIKKVISLTEQQDGTMKLEGNVESIPMQHVQTLIDQVVNTYKERLEFVENYRVDEIKEAIEGYEKLQHIVLTYRALWTTVGIEAGIIILLALKLKGII